MSKRSSHHTSIADRGIEVPTGETPLRLPTRDRGPAEPGSNVLLKEAGEDKEHHVGRLGGALPLFDIDAYVEDFNREIVGAYRRGTADRELPADVGLARSIVPPGTSATRDFSHLALTIPDLIAEACVGCMSCVNACPDTAIIAVALSESDVAASIKAFAADEANPDHAAATARSHFADTQKYGELPARKGHERGQFGIFVDPVHCKGCAECVEVCHALGYDALQMIDKVPAEPFGQATTQAAPAAVEAAPAAVEAAPAGGAGTASPAETDSGGAATADRAAANGNGNWNGNGNGTDTQAFEESAAHALQTPWTGANGEPAPAGFESTLERYERDMRFFRSLPPTPPEYRNERALADIMLGEFAFGYVGGAGSCAGCGEATAIRMLVAATRQVHGPESMGIVAATGCNTVYGGTYPFNPYLVPWTNSLFENAPAVALGIRARWDATGHADRRLWVLGGDGAMYDIGFQSLSRMLATGSDIKALVLDTQVYSNTGGQASTASFGGQVTKLSAFGKEIHGRPEPRKELGRILMAHGNVYVAQTTTAHFNHFYRAIMEANNYPGPAVVIVYTPCQPEHGIADDASNRQSKLAVESRAFPLFTYDPRKGPTVAERLSLQGNPALKADWATHPDGTPVDFLAFARTEARFAPHFAADGTPSAEITATQEDRLANWRTLRELAGS